MTTSDILFSLVLGWSVVATVLWLCAARRRDIAVSAMHLTAAQALLSLELREPTASTAVPVTHPPAQPRDARGRFLKEFA